MTWHQWHAAYPTESRTALSSALARSNASSPHGYQSTGLSACWRRYGLVWPARRFISLLSPSQAPALRRRSAKPPPPRPTYRLARGARSEPLGGGGLGPPVVRLARRRAHDLVDQHDVARRLVCGDVLAGLRGELCTLRRGTRA